MEIVSLISLLVIPYLKLSAFSNQLSAKTKKDVGCVLRTIKRRLRRALLFTTPQSQSRYWYKRTARRRSPGPPGRWPRGRDRYGPAGPGPRPGVSPARADAHHPFIRLDDVAGAGDQKGPAQVHGEQHRLQTPQDAVGAPVLGQLHHRPGEVALVGLQLGLQALNRVRASAVDPAKPAMILPW